MAHLRLPVTVALATAAIMAGLWWSARADRELARRMDAELVVRARGGDAVACRGGDGRLRLLVLGQSLAGNHMGEQEAPGDARPSVTVFDGETCRRAADPLPFATGAHRSLWSGLELALAERGRAREVMLALLAVSTTRIDDWTRASSPLVHRLDDLLGRLAAVGWVPDLVLWQQGEADGRFGTASDSYVVGFESLRAHLRAKGISAPILMARSTRCGAGPSEAIRAAIDELVRRHDDLVEGPDIDAIDATFRQGDCHLTVTGGRLATGRWADALVARMPVPPTR